MERTAVGFINGYQRINAAGNTANLILRVTLRHWDKLYPDEPLGYSPDFIFY